MEGLAAGWIDLLNATLRQKSVRENGKVTLSMKVSGLVWLGLVWWDWQLDGRIFFMPRFVRNLSENGKEILSMKGVVIFSKVWFGGSGS